MTQLIKRHSLPRKYLALERGTLLKSNHLYRLADYKDQQEINQDFNTNNNQTKELLLEHIKSIKNDRIKGLKRGANKDQENLLCRIFEAFFYWQNTIKPESTSILKIATKISETILNNDHCISHYNDYNTYLTNQLRSYFKISIRLPESVYNEHYSWLSSYQELSGDMALLTMSKHDKEPELRISIIQEIFVLCLSGIDIGYLLAKITAFFVKMNRSAIQS